jgi:hypothetical protein
MENEYGHRMFPDGKRMMFDERCDGCQCPRMRDAWEEYLNIYPSDLRKTLNVKKLREVIDTIIAEPTP